MVEGAGRDSGLIRVLIKSAVAALLMIGLCPTADAGMIATVETAPPVYNAEIGASDADAMDIYGDIIAEIGLLGVITNLFQGRLLEDTACDGTFNLLVGDDAEICRRWTTSHRHVRQESNKNLDKFLNITPYSIDILGPLNQVQSSHDNLSELMSNNQDNGRDYPQISYGDDRHYEPKPKRISCSDPDESKKPICAIYQTVQDPWFISEVLLGLFLMYFLIRKISFGKRVT